MFDDEINYKWPCSIAFSKFTKFTRGYGHDFSMISMGHTAWRRRGFHGAPPQAFFVLHNGLKEAELEQKEKDTADISHSAVARVGAWSASWVIYIYIYR